MNWINFVLKEKGITLDEIEDLSKEKNLFHLMEILTNKKKSKKILKSKSKTQLLNNLNVALEIAKNEGVNLEKISSEGKLFSIFFLFSFLIDFFFFYFFSNFLISKKRYFQ